MSVSFTQTCKVYDSVAVVKVMSQKPGCGPSPIIVKFPVDSSKQSASSSVQRDAAVCPPPATTLPPSHTQHTDTLTSPRGYIQVSCHVKPLLCLRRCLNLYHLYVKVYLLLCTHHNPISTEYSMVPKVWSWLLYHNITLPNNGRGSAEAIGIDNIYSVEL